ncbi:c6 transcription [Moniliophthora roreri]|uniref:Zn(2)-C6 fungal-type domain-containing protein n=1 Tax=Moniliophthora roreri TaxID=221103 RepID=A0A0W0FA11_MONRR|nr:c6 transcription [Moniliophthora roreri]
MSTPSSPSSAAKPSKRVIRRHIKSRSGCATCKRRRIKCDEAEPQCNNCHVRDLDCVWKNKVKSTNVALVKPLSAPAPIALDTTSLQLIHHFTTATSATYCSDFEYTAATVIAVPQLSWFNSHLLHAMLSGTALHLGRLYPNDLQWITLASTHRKAAIDALPGAMNPDAKFISIGFFSMYTISSSLSSSPENIFSLVTSLHNVWSSLKIRGHAYANPSLKDFNPFVASARYVSGLESVEVLEPLRQIYDIDPSDSQVVGMDVGLDSEELLDPGVKEAYRTGVEALYAAYPLSRIGLEAKSAVVWPALCGKWFLALLNERRQRALVVLCFYLVMLREVSERCWWASDVGKCLEYVYGLLDSGWRDWLNEALIEMNCLKVLCDTS